MVEKDQQIRQAVRERYGALAAQAEALESCCAPQTSSSECSCSPALYDAQAEVLESCCAPQTSGSECSCSPALYDAQAEVLESCCAPQTSGSECSCSPALYDAQVLGDMPVDVSGFTLGCGDPVTLAGLQAGEVVVDLGSGGGLDCFLAARQVGETGRVIGVDMTPQMLARARAKAESLGIGNVEFREGTIEALPVEDNTADVVMSNCVINLSPDKVAVFREVYRVLKPGGRASISDIVTEGEFSAEALADLGSWTECVSGAIDAEQYASMLREAGFVDVQVVDKYDAEGIVERKPGMPRLFSARVVGRKPA